MKKMLLLSVSLLSVSSAAFAATTTTPVTKPCLGSVVTKDICETQKAGVQGLFSDAQKATDEKLISEIAKAAGVAHAAPASGTADTRLSEANKKAMQLKLIADQATADAVTDQEKIIVGTSGAAPVPATKFTFTKTATVTTPPVTAAGVTTAGSTTPAVKEEVTFDTAGFATLSGFAKIATDDANLKAKLKAHLQTTYAAVEDSEVDALAAAVKPILDATIAAQVAAEKAAAVAALNAALPLNIYLWVSSLYTRFIA